MSLYVDIALKLIKEAEGFMHLPYICPAGKLTQGYGRNLEVHPLSKAEQLQLDNGAVDEETASKWVLDEVLDILDKLSDNKVFKDLSINRKALIIDLAFNIGYSGIMKFKKMWTALEYSDYALAARELKDSKWYLQVGRRGKRNYTIMATGDIVSI